MTSHTAMLYKIQDIELDQRVPAFNKIPEMVGVYLGDREQPYGLKESSIGR